jgi:exodeoxyribonuclease VIII
MGYVSNVMIDLETMGLGPNAAIVAIGAVEMDFENNKLGREFYRVVDLESSMATGGAVEASAIMWWIGQGKEARRAICAPGDDIKEVLAEFRIWLPAGSMIWGYGAGFDNVILSAAYTRIGELPPWPHWANRCFRTALAGASREARSTWAGRDVAHHALEDAKAQGNMLLSIVNTTGGHCD